MVNPVKNYNTATLIGSGALLLWAVEPLLVAELSNLPIFQVLTMVFSSCFIFTITRLFINHKVGLILHQKWYVWLIGLITICGSDFCYMYAAHLIPIAHVDFIDYLWPCLLVTCIGFLPKEKLYISHIFGTLLGLFGIWQLFSFDNTVMLHGNSFNILGYGVALLGICCWGGYSIFSKYNLKVPIDMVGAYCGLGALIAWGLHNYYEVTVIPSWSEVGMAVVLGLAGPGLAYQLWDYGIKYGCINTLSTGCYLSRVLAIMLLVVFGKEPFSKELVIALILTCCGVVIANAEQIKNKIKLLSN